MKKFDLERALAGDPVVTRDGNKVLEIHHFKKMHQQNRCLSAVLEKQDIIYFYFKEGNLFLEKETGADLFMAPVKRKGYVAIYSSYNPATWDTKLHCTDVYFKKENLEEVLQKCLSNKYLKIIEIELEV